MDLYAELIIKLLKEEQIDIIFPELNLSLAEIIEMKCYNALNNIRNIVHDTALDDKECFIKIEKIFFELEKLGSNGGFRHNFNFTRNIK